MGFLGKYLTQDIQIFDFFLIFQLKQLWTSNSSALYHSFFILKPNSEFKWSK